LAALAVLAGPSRAELSAEVGLSEIGVMILGVIEGPDPIPQIIWEPIRDIDPALILNPSGAARGDGRPDVAFDPATGRPHVVWAYNSGTDFDIAHSYWNGNGWTAPEFLTADAESQLDPRIFIDESAIYVTWWEPGAGSVWLITQPRGNAWQLAEQVEGQHGMRPSVVTWGGTVIVASESDDGQGGHEIQLSTRGEQGIFNTQLVSVSSQDQALDVMLHTESDRLWMDWRHSGTQFAYSEFEGSTWNPATTVPWIDTSWLRLEQVHLAIRNLVVCEP
jgi:hypothetical protein